MTLVVALVLVAAGTVCTFVLARRAARSAPSGRSPFDAALRRRRAGPPRPLELDRIENAVALALVSGRDLHVRLRPLLAEVAAERLGRRGVDLAHDGERAREILGTETWELLRPDRPLPDRAEPPPTLPALVAVVERVEAL